MPRSHSVCVVKGSPNMRAHTSNTFVILYSQSPFPFLITSVSFVSGPPASSGYLYHDFTDKEAEDQKWGKLVTRCWETLFILSPLGESQSALADSSLPKDLSLILFPNPACLRVCRTDWLVKESLLFKLHLNHQSYSVPIVPTYYQSLYVGLRVL